MNNIISNGEDFFSQMQGKKVLVVGDLMIDQYIWGDVSRVSPEAPVPVVVGASFSYSTGVNVNVPESMWSGDLL